MPRDRAPERVEMISGDPRAFGTTPVSSGSTPSPAPKGPTRPWIMVGALVAVALVVALVWPRSTHHPLAAATTTSATVDTPTSVVSAFASLPPPTGRPANPLRGRPAPTPIDGATIGVFLKAVPLQVSFGNPLAVQLEGDLDKVAPELAALVWLDRRFDDGWQTVAWVAQVSPGVQVLQNTGSGIDTGPSPDAITVPRSDAFGVNLDGLAGGTYRVCRYVPITANAGTVPIDNPVYLCAPVNLT